MSVWVGPPSTPHAADLRSIARSIEPAFPSAAAYLRGIAAALDADSAAAYLRGIAALDADFADREATGAASIRTPAPDPLWMRVLAWLSDRFVR